MPIGFLHWLCVAIAVLFAMPAISAGEGRIVAVGDLHGDAEAFDAILRAARLTGSDGRWIGGGATLVQLGDVPDRGPDTLKIIRRLQALQGQARRTGGRVVALVGNHEAMNVTGDLRYVHPGEYAAFADARSARRREQAYADNRVQIEARFRTRDPALGTEQIKAAWLAETPLGWVEHRLAWSPRGQIGRWVTGNPAVAKVGRTLFVHGGLSPAYAKRGIDAINREAAAALAARNADHAAIINAEDGPLWYRGLARSEMPEGELGQMLSALDADRIVIAHTPTKGQIETGYGGRVVRVDTGISRPYGGHWAYLDIEGDRVVGHAVPRPGDRGGNRQ